MTARVSPATLGTTNPPLAALLEALYLEASFRLFYLEDPEASLARMRFLYSLRGPAALRRPPQ